MISKILIPEIAKGEPNISIFAIARSVLKGDVSVVQCYLMKRGSKIEHITEVKGVKFQFGTCYRAYIDDFKVNPLPTKIKDKIKVVFFVERYQVPEELMEDLLYSTEFDQDEVLVIYTTNNKINYIYDRKVNLELYETLSKHNLNTYAITVYDGMVDSITEKKFTRCDIITFDGIIASGYGETKEESQKDAEKWIEYTYKSDSYSYGFRDVSIMDYITEMIEGNIYIITYKEDKYQAPNDENNGYISKTYLKYEFMKLDLKFNYIVYSKDNEKIPDDNSLEKYYEGGYRDITVKLPGTEKPFYAKYECPSIRVIHKDIMIGYLDICDFITDTIKNLATKISLCEEDFLQTEEFETFKELSIDTLMSHVDKVVGKDNEYVDYLYEFFELNNFEFNAEKENISDLVRRFMLKNIDNLINHGISSYKQIYRK